MSIVDTKSTRGTDRSPSTPRTHRENQFLGPKLGKSVSPVRARQDACSSSSGGFDARVFTRLTYSPRHPARYPYGSRLMFEDAERTLEATTHTDTSDAQALSGCMWSSTDSISSLLVQLSPRSVLRRGCRDYGPTRSAFYGK